MKKINFWVNFLFIFALISCSGLIDSVVELPGGYEFVSESKSDQLIHGNNILIPCTVTSYSHNKDFIIAAQSPADSCIQPNNVEAIAPMQFWVINIPKKELFGPMTLSEFISLRKKLKIPEQLKIKIEI